MVAIYCDENKVRCAEPGENLRVRLAGIEEEDIISGFVLSSVGNISLRFPLFPLCGSAVNNYYWNSVLGCALT